MFKKSEHKKEQPKAKEKKRKEIGNEIFVETKSQAALMERKRKLKLFDF